MAEPQVPETQEQFETFMGNLVVDTKEAKIIEGLWSSFDEQERAIKILQTALKAGASKNKKEINRLETGDQQGSKMAEQQVPDSHEQFEIFMSRLTIDTEEAKVIEKLWGIFHDNQTATKNLQIAVLQSTTRSDRKEIDKLQTLISHDKDEIQKLRIAASNDADVIYRLQKRIDKNQVVNDGLRYEFEKLKADTSNKINQLHEYIKDNQAENDTLRSKIEKLEIGGSDQISKLQECIAKNQVENDSLRSEVNELRLENFIQEVALRNCESKIEELTSGIEGQSELEQEADGRSHKSQNASILSWS